MCIRDSFGIDGISGKMKRTRRIHYFICLLSTAVLCACATPGAPTGGPLDKTPPRVISYQPENLSKNVEGKTFTITFDEWVQISNTRQQVIISPPVATFPDITARKNEVDIRFKENLRPNTTYSIFFGESIKDIRENNPANNIRYVFSSGPVIDSLSISGQLVLAAGESLPENTYAFLYTNLEDSAVVKEKPAYAFKFNKGKDFRFDYLPAGTYRLIALSDKNNNFLYDLPTEWIGAYRDTIILDNSINGLNLPIMLPEPEAYKITEYSTTLQNNILQIKWNKAYNPENDPFSVRILNAGTIIKKPQYFTTFFSEYYVLSDSNSISCEVISQGNILDTIRLKTDPKGLQAGVFRTTPQAVGKYSNLSLYQNQQVLFQSSIPIASLQEDKITVVDSAGKKVAFTLTREDSLWSFTILPKIQYGAEYQMKLQDSAVGFINQIFSKEQEFRVSLAPTTQFGKITFNVKLPSADTAYLISIKASNGKILSEAFVDGDTQYVFVSPPLTAGGYLVEVLEDKNRSYTWNGGSFWNKTGPERVFRSETVNVKENWEQEIKVVADFSKPVLPLPAPEEKETPAPQDKSAAPNNKGTQDNRPMFDR
jgi:hypothetical protein